MPAAAFGPGAVWEIVVALERVAQEDNGSLSLHLRPQYQWEKTPRVLIDLLKLCIN